MQIRNHVVFREGECDLLTLTPGEIRVQAYVVTPKQLGALMRACLVALNRIAEDESREDQAQAQAALLAWDRFRPARPLPDPTTAPANSAGESKNPPTDN